MLREMQKQGDRKGGGGISWRSFLQSYLEYRSWKSTGERLQLMEINVHCKRLFSFYKL